MYDFERPDRLRKAVDAALTTGEIREGLRNAGFPDDYVRADIESKTAEVWQAVNSEVLAFDDSRKKLGDANDKLREQDALIRHVGPWIFNFSFFGLVCSSLSILYWIFKDQLDYVMPEWVSPLLLRTILVGGAIFFFLITGFLIKHFVRVMRVRDELTEKLQLSSLSEAKQQADVQLDNALIAKGVLPLIREKVNQELAPSYAMTLPAVRGQGLAEVFHARYEIPTIAKDAMDRILLTMPGGSVGVAGPRGAGKTTLIRSFCEGFTKELKGRRVLSLMVDAPVHYDARDFVLHLFSKVCHGFLRLERTEYEPEDTVDSAVTVSVSDSTLLGLSYLSRTLTTAGFLLCMIGIALLADALEGTVDQTIAKAAADTSIDPTSQTPIDSKTDIEKRNGLFFEGLLRTIIVFAIMGRFVVENFGSVAGALGLNAGPCLLSGLGLGAAGVGFYLYTKSVRRESRGRRLVERDPGPDGPLVKQATRWLRKIKFQQSFTSGWSGTLNLPIGLSGTIQQNSALARQPLSLPEIVDGYRTFVKQVINNSRKSGLVIIGIDEMDKMRSDEDAQNFLNEIKMLFGIEHCFYLVSVSESAMSSFERRGLPFRNTFDSSFDDIITVKYLELVDATKLLHRRVIGLPVPFLDLCHCISGGLARDLIRSCRGLLEYANVQRDLKALATALIYDDVAAKCRAIAVTAKDIPLQPYSTAFLEELHALGTESAAAREPQSLVNTFIGGASRLQAMVERNLAAADQIPAGTKEHLDQIGHLGGELVSYLAYAATILELFALEPTEQAIKTAEQGRLLDEIAQARQLFTINPSLTLSIVNQVRDRLNLAPAPLAHEPSRPSPQVDKDSLDRLSV